MNDHGTVEGGSNLEAQVDDAILRHPSGRRGLGFRLVELPPRARLLECHRCGALLRVDSPALLDHHRGHRRRPSVWGRATRTLFRARVAAGASLSRAEGYLRALFARS